MTKPKCGWRPSTLSQDELLRMNKGPLCEAQGLEKISVRKKKVVVLLVVRSQKNK